MSLSKKLLPFFIIGLFLPCVAKAFVVRFEPAEIDMAQDETVVITLILDTEGETINLQDISFVFQPENINVVDHSQGGSVFPLWLEEPEVDRFKGTIRFVAGIWNPGFSGQGKFADITVKALKPGVTALETTPQSTVYLHDGLGTPRFLSASSSVRLTVRPSPAVTLPSMPAPSVFPTTPFQPRIFSVSHPDPVQWYTERQISLEWEHVSNTEYSFAFDAEPFTIPDTVSETAETRTTVVAPSDGRWYFHLRLRDNGSWSETAHWRVQIDTASPEPFDVTLIQPTPEFQDQYALAFFTTDATSGVSHFEIQEPSRLVSVFVGPYILVRQEPGFFQTRVTAVDLAGNRTERTISIYIPYLSTNILFWVFIAALFVLALVILFLVLRTFLWKKIKKEKVKNIQNKKPEVL